MQPAGLTARLARTGAGGRPVLDLARGISAHAAVAKAIGMRIVRGDDAPRSVLPNEGQWAADFNVGRSVIREAIKVLMARGLLTSRPKVGSRVEPGKFWTLWDRDVLARWSPSPDSEMVLRSLQQFRRIIEPEAVALAVHRLLDNSDAMSAGTGPAQVAVAIKTAIDALDGRIIPQSVRLPLAIVEDPDFKDGENFYADLSDNCFVGNFFPTCGINFDAAEIMGQTKDDQ